MRVTGAANHSGTTAMELRKDALVAAAELGYPLDLADMAAAAADEHAPAGIAAG